MANRAADAANLNKKAKKAHKAKSRKSNKSTKIKKTPEEKVARSAKLKECSAQAGTQNLHGKLRKAFRRTCMQAAA